jgi:hypothetical protein
MMTELATHKNERIRIGCCSRKAGKMTMIVARRVEEVERTVSEEVESPEVTNLQ